MVQEIIIILLLAVCVILGYATVRLNNLLDIKEKTHDELKTRHFLVIKDLDKTRETLNDVRAERENFRVAIEELNRNKNDLINKILMLETELEAAKKESTKPTEEVVPKKITTRRTTKKVEPAEPEKVEEPKKTTRRTTKK